MSEVYLSDLLTRLPKKIALAQAIVKHQNLHIDSGVKTKAKETPCQLRRASPGNSVFALDHDHYHMAFLKPQMLFAVLYNCIILVKVGP